MNLPRYSWDQAAILNIWSPAAFPAIGITAVTVRQWASRGHVTAVGIGPNGSRLYQYEAVARHAQRTRAA